MVRESGGFRPMNGVNRNWVFVVSIGNLRHWHGVRWKVVASRLVTE